MIGLLAPGSWVITNEPSGLADNHTQPEPKRPTPLASNSALNDSRLPHCFSIWARRVDSSLRSE